MSLHDPQVVNKSDAQHAGGRNKLTGECLAFRGTLGAKVLILRPRDPEGKGIIERAHDYLERSFLPGRRFASPADFNRQLQAWLDVVNWRRRRALGCAPMERVAADRAAMLALPPVAPATGWRISGRLPRDFYVRLDGNDYSVHPSVIGRRIEVIADLDRVRAFCDGQLVAHHTRLWAKHQSVTAPEHEAAARQLRRERIGLARPAIDSGAGAGAEVQIRCLADYDTALGIDTDSDAEGGVA